jgi:hypothetical protein
MEILAKFWRINTSEMVGIRETSDWVGLGEGSLIPGPAN